MTRTQTGTTAAEAFYDGLVQNKLIYPLGVQGVFGRGAVFEDVITRLNELIDRTVSGDRAEKMHFPPVLPRQLIEESGFVSSFPHLAGMIFSFQGSDAEHRQLQETIARGEDSSRFQTITEVSLTSAACYPVYPTCSGVLPADGRLIDVSSYCFRHEPSSDPARLQVFRQREHIRMGTPEMVAAWRSSWVERGVVMLRTLGLPVDAVPAADPFFGRAGKMLAANQLEQRLKFEIVVPITSEERPTAIMSFNYHQDYFSAKFAIETAPGQLAHTACLGFGMERIVMAMFQHHGFDISAWPDAVKHTLRV